MGQKAGFCLMLLRAASLLLLSGCLGVSQNPSYFPHLLPTEDIIRTHAKPPGPSYFSNFDPHAVRLEVRPLEATNPVRTQQVLIATVYDEKGVPRRNRRVEWMVEGAGNIVEVDESGLFPGRGYKVDNKYAVSYTDYQEHVITRGNVDPNDDFAIRPGQSWCVISSAVEGDTHVTVYAPEIADWDKHNVFVTAHWVDAEWILPPPSVNRAGSEHVITSNIFRHTDRQPLANYRVRYRILDGPPAIFLPDRPQETVAVSDLNGNASASLVQVSPQAGSNRIGVEIIRPPDPLSPSGAGIVIGRGETAKTWQGAQVSLRIRGPESAAIGQDIPYTITVTNMGQVESSALTLRGVLPEGLQFVRSEPPASLEGKQLIWTFGALPGGQSENVQLVLRADRAGPATTCAAVTTVEGWRDEKCVTTQITAPQPAQLTVTMSDQATALVGAPFTYQITVTNTGGGPANNILLSARFDPGLEHDTRANLVELPLGSLAPGQTKTVPLTLIPRRVGRFSTHVTAAAEGNLRAEAERTVTVQTARLTITKTGPKALYVDQAATWEIAVANPGETLLTNVVIRDRLAAELSYVSATEAGQFSNGEVVWNLGNLSAGEKRVVQVTARCLKVAVRVVNVAVATADPGLQEQAEAVLEIRGLPAYSLDVLKVGDPVLVGDKVIYRIAVTNTGSLPGNQIEIVANVPAQMLVTNTDGPSKARFEGNRVIFPAVDGLEPKGTFSYTVEVRALHAADVRFRVELRAATLTAPVIKEESTNIYAPTNGKGPAPVPPPPPP